MPDTIPKIDAPRLAAMLLIAALLAVMSAPCAPVRAQNDDTITIGMTDFPRTLDPGDAYDFNTWEVLSHLYTGLTRQVPGTLGVELALAEAVAVSDDRLTYTFTLRESVAFEDGTPITAQTFVDSINRVIALRRAAAGAVTPYVAAVTAEDARTLVFTLTRPVPYFLMLVALPPYFPQHPDLAATTTAQPFADNFVGNGPYTLASFALRDQIVLTANPVFDLGAPPKTGTIVLKYFPRSQDLRNAIAAHEVDIAWRALLLEHLDGLARIDGLTITDVPGTRVFYLYFGQVREPTDDPLVREALTVLVEREGAADAVFAGRLSALRSLVPALYPDAYAPIWPDDPDVERAETLLGAAGYRERQTSRLSFFIAFSQYVYGVPYTAGVIRLARDSFNATDYLEYSVQTEIEAGAFFDVLQEGTGSVAIYGWTPIVPHPYAYLYPLLHSSQDMPRNSRYASPEIDALLDTIAMSGDAETIHAAYRDIARLLYDDAALVPLWQDHVQVVAWDDISGVQPEPYGFLHYDQLVREQESP